MRAILLARATVTSIFGLRANICASHDPLTAPRLPVGTSAPEPAKGSHHHSARNPRANARSAVQRSTMPVGICIGGDPFFIARKNSRREIRKAAETLNFRIFGRSYQG